VAPLQENRLARVTQPRMERPQPESLSPLSRRPAPASFRTKQADAISSQHPTRPVISNEAGRLFLAATPPTRHFERSEPTFSGGHTAHPSFRTERADFFFRIRSCECDGPRREKSLFSSGCATQFKHLEAGMAYRRSPRTSRLLRRRKNLQGSSRQRRNHHSGMARDRQRTRPSHPRPARPPCLRLKLPTVFSSFPTLSVPTLRCA
jgi:hypothetical protein